MRKLIIHIGAHKTGSTAIQKFFFDYNKFFEKNFDLIYPIEHQVAPKYGFWGHHYLTWYFNPPGYKRVNINTTNQALNSFIEQISSYEEKVFLISSEDFTWNYKVKEFINHIKGFFDDIYVVMYVRRQIEAAPALYQTGVVNEGLTISFQEWFKKAQPLFNYWDIAERWESAGCKMIVRPFMKDKFHQGDVILDFLEAISLLLDKKLTPPPDYKPNSIRVNISVPDFICTMIRFYNEHPSRDKVVPVLKELGYKLIELFPDLPKLDFIPPSEKNKIVEMYKDSNKRLCEKYLNLKYLDWLNKEVAESDEVFLERFGYPGSQLVELAKVLIKIIDKLKKEV